MIAVTHFIESPSLALLNHHDCNSAARSQLCCGFTGTILMKAGECSREEDLLVDEITGADWLRGVGADFCNAKFA